MFLHSLAILAAVGLLAGASAPPAQADGLGTPDPTVQLAADEKASSPQQSPATQLSGVETGKGGTPTAATDPDPNNAQAPPETPEMSRLEACLSWRILAGPLCLLHDDDLHPEQTKRMIPDPIATTVAEPEKTEEATDGTALAAVAPTGEAVDPTADLPPVEALDANSDYTGFLRDGVPEALRNAALRRLWRSSPLFAFRDGLGDYDEDFRAAAPVVEGLKRVARGRKGAALERVKR